MAGVARRILIVEDEAAIAGAVAYALKREGFETRVAADGEAGLRLAEQIHPDLVILDLMLPGLGGLEVCRLLRRRSPVPIIMLTAKAEETDRVVGLEVGADDYVTKPFSMRELIARVRAVLRRQELAAQASEQPRFDDGHLVVDLEKPRVELAGSEVRLSPRELSLLRVLLAHRGRARTRQQLLDEAWGEDEYVDPRTVDVHVRWLRQKVEPDPEHPRYIETVRGVGYRFSQ
jgi:DNA-binding response OmpR family regulator